MKYEDLTKMYYDINGLWNDINELFPDVNPLIVHEINVNWILSTIHEELRNIEVYTSQCD